MPGPRADQVDQRLPEITIGDRLLLGVLPPASQPTAPPVVAEAVHDIGRVRHHLDRPRLGSEHAQCLEHRLDLHALVGGVRRPARSRSGTVGRHRPGPTTWPGIPRTCPIGVHDGRGDFGHGGTVLVGNPARLDAMIFDGFVHQLPDTDPIETQEWLDSLAAVIDTHGKTRARFLLSKLLESAREAQVEFPATVSTPYINTIPREHEPWFPGDEHVERRIRAFIRWNAAVMVARGQQARRRHRWPPLHLRLLREPVRDRVQPLLPRQGRRPARRPRVLPRSRRARCLCPGLPRGPDDRGRSRPLPPRDRTRRAGPVELPAPAPDARFLGVPDGVDGPRPDHRALPRSLQPLPPQPTPRRHERQPGLGVPGRRRVRRARDPGCVVVGQSRRARQPRVRRELQPAAARRPGARQRQDHPGARGRVPRRRLERRQGDLGLQVGRPARTRRRRRAAQSDEQHRRR